MLSLEYLVITETDMSFSGRMVGRLGAIKEWLAARERERALASFSCSHCDRNAQCGREPSADCLEKHAQISRGDDWRCRQAGRDLKLPYS